MQIFKMDILPSSDDNNDNKNNSKVKEEDRTFANFANQGLTVIPVNIFKRRYITKLDLSDNNIRSIPADIANLTNLKYLNLSRNGFRCTHCDDPSSIPKEMKKIRCLEYLNISECNLAFIPSNIWEIVSLTHLDISRNKIKHLPPDVGNLDQMKWLNAQHTGITTVPEEIVGCIKLETLLLYGNQISTLPHILADIPNLKMMSLNLRHMAEKVDSDMESLLQSGQIKSDHISNTIFNLPKLEKIELEFCKINFVQRFHSQHLTELLLRGNLFREIPSCIFDLTKLQTLDLTENYLQSIGQNIIRLDNLRILLISKNNLESVSNHIFKMKSLETLDLSHNHIQNISIPVNFENFSLKRLNLHNNKVETVPESIKYFKSLEDLELTNNKIKELPLDLCLMTNITRIHQYDGIYRVGLWLLNNPIIFPPENIWNTTDVRAIFSFLEKSKIQRINKIDPVRIVLLGDDNFQKIRFLDKFLNKKRSKTFQFLTIERWKSPNSVPFVIINVDSDSIYSLLWRYFIDDNSLIWLFVDEKDDLTNQCRKWIDVVSNSANNCIIQLIVQRRQQQEECGCVEIKEASENNLKQQLHEIRKEIKEKYREINFKILPNPFLIENEVELSVMEAYKCQLEYQAIDVDLFVEDKSFDIFKDHVTNIETLCKLQKVVYLDLKTFSAKLKNQFFIEDSVIHKCLEILHKQGRLFWFNKYNGTRSKIYPFISTFLNSILSLIKSDYNDDLDMIKNPLLRASGIKNEDIVNKIKDNFYNYGEISLPFYKILTFSLSKSLELKDFLVDAQVSWTVPIPAVPRGDSFIRPFIVFPFFNKVSLDEDYFLNRVFLKGKRIHSHFILKVHHDSLSISDEVFLHLVSAVNVWAQMRYDWRNLCYIIREDGDVVLHRSPLEGSNLRIDIIARSWSTESLDFQKWFTDWFYEEFKTSFSQAYSVNDVMENNVAGYLEKLLL